MMKKTGFLILATAVLVSGLFICSTLALSALGSTTTDAPPAQSNDTNTTVENNHTQDKGTASQENSAPSPAVESNTPDQTQEDVTSTSDVKTDTGRYVGQIDANSIEIKISGVPDEISAKAFRLKDAVKDNFESYGLNTGDEIKIEYVIENGQSFIVKIEKL